MHTFGIRMLDLPGSKAVKAALQALALAEEGLETEAAEGSSGSGSGLERQQRHALAAALLARIRFRRLLLEGLLALQQYSAAGVEPLSSR